MKIKDKLIQLAIGSARRAALAALPAAALSCGGRNVVNVSTAFAERGVLETTIMATGYIQPVEQVEVGTQVSGVVERIYVDFNSVVRKGDLLAELDKSTLNEKLSQARSNVTSAQSNLTYARQNFDRVTQLHNAKAATAVALEEAVNQLDQAQTSYDNALANLNTARVDLSYADIFSPIDGVVLDRSIAEGQTVAASFSTPTLFTIAEDLTKMQVEADVDEADIGRVREGQAVTFTVDAYPDDTFHGTVSQIRLQPTVTNNVVTYTVIVEAPNDDEKLFPGMTANITVVTASESGIVVPLSALTFRMTEETASRLNLPEETAMQGGPSMRSVWVKNGDRYESRTVAPGINDGVETIIESGLAEGEEVVLNVNLVSKKSDGEVASNPLMPGRPGGNRR
ncbi:MAG: efflux RND transporter periplasmic adaptor subunit [Rikenellaceae bacterium]|nr:efflux RND transporter periplasmic adaptor subunit [Rikenellaceae bacterium]